MSDLFHFVTGLTSSVADYVQQQRDIQRDREDKELAFTRQTLENMATRPDFDSSQYASMLNYMHSLSGARPLKKGMAGFMGQHEALPISQMIAGVTSGDPSKPFVGDPTKTAVNDTLLQGAAGGAGATGAPDPSQSAPATGLAPEPNQSPAPRLAPPPLPQTPAPPQAKPALQPQPPAAVPQPPGTSNMLKATNEMAMDSQVQAAAPKPAAAVKPPATGPLPMPPGIDDASVTAARAKRPTGTGSMFRTPDEMAINAGRSQFTSQIGASAGRMAGMRQELREMLGREPSAQELLMYQRGMVERGQLVEGYVTDESGNKTVKTVVWDPIQQIARDPDTQQPVANFTRTGAGAALPRIQFVTQPDGSIKLVEAPRIGGDATVSDVAGARGRVQFAPGYNIQDYDQTTGQNVNRIVPRPVVGGSVPPQQSAPTGGAGSQGTPNALPAPPLSSRATGATATAGGQSQPGMTIRSNPRAKFSDQQKGALSGIESAERFARQALDFIKQNHLENDNLALDAKWNNFLYNIGVDPGETEKLIQNVGIAEPKAILGQMGGQRGQYWGELLARHTAQASNSYQLMAKKLQNMITIGEGIKKDINQSALQVPTTGGPQIPGQGGASALPQPPGQPPAAGGDQFIYAKDPATGVVHKAKPGTPLPQGWVLTDAQGNPTQQKTGPRVRPRAQSQPQAQ